MSGWTHFVLRLTDRSDVPARETPEERTRTYAMALLADTREESSRADQKAAILLAAMGVVVGAVLASLLSGSWSSYGLAPPWRALWWAGTATALAGVGCFGAAVFPRVRGPRGRTEVLGFYGDVAAYLDDTALRRALEVSSALALERVVSQLREVSSIVVRKYLLLRTGMLLSGVSVLCLVGVLLQRM